MRSVSGALGAESSPFGVADLERRTATALVYAVVVLAALFAPAPTFAVLVAVFAVLGYIELRALFRYRSYQPWSIRGFFTLAFVFSHLVPEFRYGFAVITLPRAIPVWVVADLPLLRPGARGRPLAR